MRRSGTPYSGHCRRTCCWASRSGPPGVVWLRDADDPAADRPLRELVPGLLDRLERRVEKRGRRIRSRDGEGLHDLRKAMKKLRYACEDVSSLFRAKAAGSYVGRVKKVLGDLGRINDAAVTETRVAALADESRPELAAAGGCAAGLGREAARRGEARSLSSLAQGSPRRAVLGVTVTPAGGPLRAARPETTPRRACPRAGRERIDRLAPLAPTRGARERQAEPVAVGRPRRRHVVEGFERRRDLGLRHADAGCRGCAAARLRSRPERVETITCPPGSLNLTAFDRRCCTI